MLEVQLLNQRIQADRPPIYDQNVDQGIIRSTRST